MVKSPPAMQETWVWSLDWEDPLEKGMTTHSSILAYRIPQAEEPGRLQSMGSQRVGHDWVINTFRRIKKGRGRELGKIQCVDLKDRPRKLTLLEVQKQTWKDSKANRLILSYSSGLVLILKKKIRFNKHNFLFFLEANKEGNNIYSSAICYIRSLCWYICVYTGTVLC